MKKRFIFSLLAIFLAGLWLGGVSMAATITPVDCDNVSAVAQIWENTCYATLANAISAASAWNTIKIIKADTYQLWWVTFDKNVTIQWLWDSTIITPETPATTLNSMANNSIKFGTLGDEVTVTLSGVKLQLSWNYAWYWFAWNKESSKVVINNSTVAWRLVTFTNMDFNSVDFVKNNVNTYNIDVHEWRNVNFTNCTFEQNDRNVNVYDWNNDNEDRHDVTFTNCSFKSSTANKWAVNIHESHENQDHVVRYNVTITNAEIEWSYPEDIEVIWQENWYFSKIVAESGLVSIDDIRRVIATEWWEITVKLGTKTIYSTPVTTNAWVTPNTAEELNTIKAWYTNNGYCVPPTGLWVVTEWSAKIWNQKYCTVTEAINEATQWQIVEILKAWEYTLPATISNNITIKWNVEWVKFTSMVNSSAGKIISTLTNWASFDNVTFVLTWVAWKDYKHYFATNDNKEINFENCTIDWTLYVDWNQTANFSNFKFVKNEVNTSSNEYNLHVYWNATFNSGTFENNQSRNVNLWHRMNNPAAEGEQYTVTFANTTFSNTASDTKKAAVMIHEARENYTTPWKVTFTNSDVLDESKYNTGFVWWSALYWIDDILTSDWHKEDPKEGTDVSYGTENWWEIKVTVDWTTVYSTPKRGQIWTVTFDWTWAKEVADGAKVEKPADPAAQGCKTFVEWQLNGVAYDFNSVVTWNLALTSKWNTSNCWWGSSWWGSSSSSSSSSTTNTEQESTWNNNTWADTPIVDPQAVQANGYTNEMNAAYEFAYANGITTMESIEEAQMEEGLTRIAMAKMLSQYAINVLGKSPADVEVPNFVDVTSDLDAEYDNWVALAYKLGIMWINMPGNKFLPFEYVTRAQFGTALSRLLFGIEDGEDAYYTTHLAKLKEAWIITNDDPTLEELRGYVMLMLYRSANDTNAVNNTSEWVVSNENTNKPVNESSVQEQEVEKYFTEAYRKWQIYGRIWDLQRLLQSLWFYNGEINNTFDNNTIDAVFDFQIAMWILPADDKSTSRWNVWPQTREALNQKWAEFQWK